MDDLLVEFLTETAEALSELDVELVKLEQNPNDPTLIASIFRLVHTIKGTCGFLGLPRLEQLAHAAENVLGKFRDRELEVTAEAVTLILQTLDQIKVILAALEQAGTEPEGEDGALIARLNAMAEGRPPVATGSAPAADQPAAAPPPPGATLFDRIGGTDPTTAMVDRWYEAILADDRLKPFFAHTTIGVQKAMMRDYLVMAFGGPNEYVGADLAAAHRHLAGQGVNGSHFDAMMDHLATALQDIGAADPVRDEVLALVGGKRGAIVGDAARPAALPAAAPVVVEAGPRPASDADALGPLDGGKEVGRAAQSIRVNVELLENLMTMVSELVLTRNQLLQMARNRNDNDFVAPLQQLNHITSELQEGVMMTRMQPIGNAWSKLPRIVRDLSVELNKKIDLELVGADTELDRQVLELIKDPLTHMVRNSADHGLEVPAERVARGKPETGRVVLNAYHEGGHIIIQISDDGRGLNVAKIKAKAVANGLASEAELAGMSDQQVLQFIFKAGFSTAEKVTSVSGRGVGMDVVRTNIEKIGGTIELQSKEGKGTTFTIKIPLTLAIVSALIVECVGERFAIPQISVLELVRASSRSEHKIERLKGTPVLRLRNRLLPLVQLHDLLKLRSAEAGEDELFVVVTQVGNYTFGIVVDRVFDTEEIVVKPVAPMLRDNPVFSGNTILGDGSVIMILDPNGIATSTGEIGVAEDDRGAQSTAASSGQGEKVPLLVFRAGSATPRAVPLALVARLEEIDCKAIEYSDNRPVVQYRGSLMPLVPIDPGHRFAEAGRQPVVVFADRDRSMGLVVDEIVDIIEEELDFELKSEGPGTIGTAVLAGRATEVIDAGYYLTQAFKDWFGSAEMAAAAADGSRRVLLVDDSPFFRNLLAPLLRTAGYKVTTADSGDKALGLCEAGESFDVIISDIEMPGMDGFAFAEAVRSNPRWQDTPMVALSAKTSHEYVARGRSAGFTDYVPKFDRDGLLHTLSQALSMTRDAA